MTAKKAAQEEKQREEVTANADDQTVDDGSTPESTEDATSTAAEADAGTASTTPEPPPSPEDEPEDGDEEEEELPDQTVLILRDETIAGKDYKPGETPKLRGADVAALVARKAGDTNAKAIAAARKARNGGGNKETVIE